MKEIAKRKKLLKSTTFSMALLVMATLIISGATSAIVIQGDSTNVNVKKENTVNWISSARENLPVINLDVQPTPVPLTPTDWLYFDDGTNSNSLGLTDGGTFEYGIRLTPAELTGYNGYTLTTVKHHHAWEGGAGPSVSGWVKIYDEGTPTSPGTQLNPGADPYTTLNVPGWEEYTLTTPIIIDATKDLWVCLEVTHLAGEFPAGMDPGPAVDGKGDWIYLDPGPWDEIQNLGFDENWNLWAGLEGETQCEPSIDVEKYVWDEKNQEWVDADTEDEALDVPVCNDATFKIVIHNNGNCPLYGINISDHMHDSLKFISADPEPGDVWYDETNSEWRMWWFFPGPLMPCENIEITLIAHVEGPKCSYDYNWVLVGAICEHGTYVEDEDTCWVHANEVSRLIYRPFLQFLDSHPNMFPLLQKLIKQLGL